MNKKPQTYSQAVAATQPIVDEDGFTQVEKPKKSKDIKIDIQQLMNMQPGNISKHVPKDKSWSEEVDDEQSSEHEAVSQHNDSLKGHTFQKHYVSSQHSTHKVHKKVCDKCFQVLPEVPLVNWSAYFEDFPFAIINLNTTPSFFMQRDKNDNTAYHYLASVSKSTIAHPDKTVYYTRRQKYLDCSYLIYNILNNSEYRDIFEVVGNCWGHTADQINASTTEPIINTIMLRINCNRNVKKNI